MSCVVYDGTPEDSGKMVDEEFCGDIDLIVNGDKNIVLEESCIVPCPGDCYLNDWSEWSLCQLTCVNGQNLGFGGVKVRSKAVIIQELENQHLCPEQMLESKPCHGGCFEVLKPENERICNPPCTQMHSYCTETGSCGCEDGYTEVMSSDGTLDQCTLIPVVIIPTSDDKKGDVKTSRAINPTQPSSSLSGYGGRTWFLQPFGSGR
ncbi:hypothetical protein AB205_0044070 [Aquarana catesbeiana]|uniref:Uncharacterized protein n=1 Tax=Aquarana catesbeiana TaxID=8400 RepID=A0A2G9SDD3_AQUCT|nr:hypothetical protein AB205_0044070 [Aquarana catesbeiana]